MNRCDKPVSARLDLRQLCRDHFIAYCYSRLDEIGMELRRNLDDANSESLRQFLQDCVEQITVLAHTRSDLDNLERAKMLDIALWASDLGRRIRRSPRQSASVRVRISGSGELAAWEEETRTRVISRHGASLTCRHAVRRGDVLHIMRCDNDRRIQARVVWTESLGPKGLEIGVEFIEPGDFWQ
jgi:hypothetical protein